MILIRRPVKALSFPPKTITISFDPEKHEYLETDLEGLNTHTFRDKGEKCENMPKANRIGEGQYSYTIKNEEASYMFSLLFGGTLVVEQIDKAIDKKTLFSEKDLEILNMTPGCHTDPTLCEEDNEVVKSYVRRIYCGVHRMFSMHIGRHIAKELRAHDTLNVDVFLRLYGDAIVHETSLMNETFLESRAALTTRTALIRARNAKDAKPFYEIGKYAVNANDDELNEYFDYLDEDGTLYVWFNNAGELMFGCEGQIGTQFDLANGIIVDGNIEEFGTKIMKDSYLCFVFLAFACMPSEIRIYHTGSDYADTLAEIQENIPAYPVPAIKVIPERKPAWVDPKSLMELSNEEKVLATAAAFGYFPVDGEEMPYEEDCIDD